MKDYIIRPEETRDQREVENLTREAFWNVYRPGCQEHYVLNQYRTNPDFIPELNFVMEVEGRIIGHVMYSKAEIVKEDGSVLPAWTFGPISIHPDYKRKGNGLKLLQYSIERAREMGIGVLCMEGNIDFYKHAGFVLASSLRIHYHGEPKESEVPYFLAQEIIPGYLNGVEGTYHTPKGYFVADEQPEAFAAYEATFPAKEKHLQEGQLPQFCQSCGMPLTEDGICGHDADGSINFDYCKFCYDHGKFAQECTMDEMIEHCSQFVDEFNKNAGQNLSREEYKQMMQGFFPMLKRWRMHADALPGSNHALKNDLIAEVNALGIPGLQISELYVLEGAFVNLTYIINGHEVQLLDDKATYWGNQIEKTDGRCYGVACDEHYIFVSEYGKDGADAEIIMIKKR